MVKLDPWYKTVTPRKEVREGRSFDPKEFAIHLEQVVHEVGPEDYWNPIQFFERTCFTRALKEHVGLIEKRLAGETINTAPVLTLITQFGGGKTHTLTTLYHLAKSGNKALKNEEVRAMLLEHGLVKVPETKIAVFVGSAWDPQPGRENPWVDIAYQLAGEEGIKALGESAREGIPPGTDALQRMFNVAGGSVLLLFDETLNFLNRHRSLAEPFYAYVQNLTIAMTATTHSALVMSLPRSQVEMTDWDITWQDRITKIVHRVAKDLIANDEAEISEVIRKRLFTDLGPERTRKVVASAYADWCFDRRNQLPPHWTMVDTAQTEAGAKEALRRKFEACYPFHPATIAVFQSKWQTLPQFQQTRGTLAMLAQWISWAYQDGFKRARKEPLITLGSAPLDVQSFRAAILGQLGNDRLGVPIDTDIAGTNSHARALDVDTKEELKDIHRRVGAAILFESSGGMVNKVASLPELRFALLEPGIDTTSVDNAALALESKAFFIRKVGTDGFQIRNQFTVKKVVSDKRASLDEDEIRKFANALVKKEFETGKGSTSILFFPPDGSEVPDTPKLTLVVLDPECEWSEEGSLSKTILDWTKARGGSARLYPYSLVWCIKKRGRDFRYKVENALAWERVRGELEAGLLGSEIEASERHSIKGKTGEAADDARDEVWASYRYIIICDNKEKNGLKVIDLGAGHASGSESLSNRIINSMKSEGLLNESVGVGYLQRNWPPALQEKGAWPLSGLRQSFLDGSLTRLVDPDGTLRKKICEAVQKGDFGLASGPLNNDSYMKVWYAEPISSEEVVFDASTLLLLPDVAKKLVSGPVLPHIEKEKPSEPPEERPEVENLPGEEQKQSKVRIVGEIPPEVWSRLGIKVIPKVRQAPGLKISLEIDFELKGGEVPAMKKELEQVLSELGLTGKVSIMVQ